MTETPYLQSTRAAYDTVAIDYAELLRDELAGKPLDRAMLNALADTVTERGGGLVADIGCGPGRVTAYLDSVGLDVFGIDLSPKMVEVARHTYPDLRFVQGVMAALDQQDGDLAGIVAWYSIIHTPPALLPTVFAEFSRVLAPGGHLLLAFQVGDEPRHLEQAYGHQISLVSYRLLPGRITELLAAAGLVVKARLIREPDTSEKVQQAYLLAQKVQ